MSCKVLYILNINKIISAVKYLKCGVCKTMKKPVRKNPKNQKNSKNPKNPKNPRKQALAIIRRVSAVRSRKEVIPNFPKELFLLRAKGQRTLSFEEKVNLIALSMRKHRFTSKSKMFSALMALVKFNPEKFAESIKDKRAFANGLGVNAGRFAKGLSFNARRFAKGLSFNAGRFAWGLGVNAGRFADVLKKAGVDAKTINLLTKK